MAAKTVALDAEAYELLRRQKREGETFSQTVKRLAGPQRSILDFAGFWKDRSPESRAMLEEFRAAGRKRDLERMERMLNRKRR